MIFENTETQTKNTEKSAATNPLLYKKQTFKSQNQESKQLIFKQVLCFVKKQTSSSQYFKALLTIWFKGKQECIIIKLSDKKRYKQQLKIDCVLLQRVLIDLSKVIIVFNKKIKLFQKDQSDQLVIKLQNKEKAGLFKSELLKFINKNNQQETKSINIRRAQFLNKDEKMERDTECQSKQIIHKQKKQNISLKVTIKANKFQQDQIQATRQTIKMLDGEIESLKKQVSQTKDRLSIQVQENKRMKQRLNLLNQQNQINCFLSIKEKEFQKQVKEKRAQNWMLEEKIKKMQKEHYQQNTYIKKEVKNLEKKIEQVVSLYKECQNRLNYYIQENKKMITIKKEDQIMIENLNTELKALNESYKQIQVKLKQTEECNSILQTKYKILQENYNKLKQQFQLKEKVQKEVISLQQYTKIQKAYNQMKYLHIFEGPVLQQHLEFKQFLKESIEKYTGKKILKTVIIYKLDKKSNINFHNYVDEHQNFVVIAKTINGFFFAGFSQSYVKAKYIANKGGLILSLTNFRVFELFKNMKSVTFDDYFMIFGNSQIRIKTQESKVFSNFGTSNGYYNAQGQSINILLGQGKLRQTMLENYEFHQIIFQDQ